MKNEELINELQKIKWKHGDDLEVFCTSDHGQDYEGVYSVTFNSYIEDGEITPLHPDDIEEGVDYPKAIFIN